METKNRTEFIKNSIPLCIVIIVSYLVTLYFAVYGFEPHHDGFMFKTSLDVSRGMTMYKDTWSQYGGLTIWIQALFIRIFGEKVWSIRIATVIMYVLCYILEYLIYRRFFSRIISMMVCLLTLAMAPFYFWNFLAWSSVYSLLFLLISLYCLIRYFENKKDVSIVLSCVTGICCFFCRQTVGLVVIASFYVVIFFLWLLKEADTKELVRIFGIYTIALVVQSVFIIMILFAQGAFSDFWIQNIKYMVKFGNSMGGGSQGTGNLIKCVITSLLAKNAFFLGGEFHSARILPFTCLIVFLFLVVRKMRYKVKFQKDELFIFILSIYCVASWHQYYPVDCFRHIFWASFPMFGVSVYVLQKIFSILFKKIKCSYFLRSLTAVIVLVLILLPDLKFRYTGSKSKLSVSYSQMTDETFGYLEGLKLTEGEVQQYTDLHTTIKQLEDQNKEKAVVNMTNDGYYACFYPTNFHPQFIYGSAYDDFAEIWEKYISENKPIIIGNVGREVKDYYVYKVITGGIIQILMPY